MPRNFNLPSLSKARVLPLLSTLKDTHVRIRLLLGSLLLANLAAAALAFHVFDDSPQQLGSQVLRVQKQKMLAVNKLSQTRLHASKVDKGRDEGTRFIATYMTNRRMTYSTILSEIDAMAAQNNMKSGPAAINLDAIQGTDSLDQMTITANFEGDYTNLLKFINQIDKSKRFLIIDSLTAVPQLNQKLQVTLKLITFVKEDSSAS